MNRLDAEIIRAYSESVIKHIPVDEFVDTKDYIVTRLRISKKAQVIMDLIYKSIKDEETNQADIESDVFSFLVFSGITKTVETIKGGHQ